VKIAKTIRCSCLTRAHLQCLGRLNFAHLLDTFRRWFERLDCQKNTSSSSNPDRSQVSREHQKNGQSTQTNL